eukprot:Selendium_serpulae@DN1194_c0_g1_i1.p1
MPSVLFNASTNLESKASDETDNVFDISQILTSVKSKTHFISGDWTGTWPAATACRSDRPTGAQQFDLILAAEVGYREDSARSIIKLLAEALLDGVLVCWSVDRQLVDRLTR